ncbi:2-dehydro-3-deoxygluconokinase [Lysinibacillus composti]|uniref:Sugar kinase n=1 Tax=Lysinibacillus composti TaxID=720633 RepID=A0A3N9UAW9_9BACI|nr:sugar kinase [Lysinibacillus composti]MBM7610228.1 2-dehydro-3-deoxygluconokinase [Lysinibacillus composti]RQW73689.1 sugar kinase [Lysinibacillus composti]
MTSKIVWTLGDALITFNPSTTGPMRYVSSFERKVGGAELNFAIGCARLGLQTKWMSRLGGDEFGKVIYNFARGEGIDMSFVKLVEGYPTSLNFKEIREDGSGKTFYYRNQSPILTLSEDDISKGMFEGVDVIHLTGVFLAIAPQNLNITMRVLKIAKENDITVSFDPNIRLKLWTIEEAKRAYAKIFPFVDILLTGFDEIELILENASKDSLERFASENDIAQLIIKDGSNGVQAYINENWYKKEAFKFKVIDTVGAGDGFDAAYIYSFLNDMSIDERLTFANAVGGLVTTVSGDNEGLPELEDVEAFLGKRKIIER